MSIKREHGQCVITTVSLRQYVDIDQIPGCAQTGYAYCGGPFATATMLGEAEWRCQCGVAALRGATRWQHRSARQPRNTLISLGF
jgi:hypothetical protein